MSSVVISNRTLFNQKVTSIEKNKVLIPFNVTRDQINKLKELLSKTKVTFLSEPDKLNIGSLNYNNINIKSNERIIGNSRFTLARTYVVTMKQSFVSKVKTFYDKIKQEQVSERPLFDIDKETNLKEALQEATVEIDIDTINNTINSNVQTSNLPEDTNQVLANNPHGETIIENPVNLNNGVEAPVTQVSGTTPEINDANVVSESINQENVVNTEQVIPQVVVQTEQVQQAVASPTPELNEQAVKVKTRKFSKGSVLAVPIVLVWLGAIFYGTVKLVTNILT